MLVSGLLDSQTHDVESFLLLSTDYVFPALVPLPNLLEIAACKLDPTSKCFHQLRHNDIADKVLNIE